MIIQFIGPVTKHEGTWINPAVPPPVVSYVDVLRIVEVPTPNVTPSLGDFSSATDGLKIVGGDLRLDIESLPSAGTS